MHRRRRGHHYHRTAEPAATSTARAAFDPPGEASTARAGFDPPGEAWQDTAAMPWAVCESERLLRAMEGMEGSEDWVARGELMPSLLLTMRP
jgi:hypothetical protein